MVQLTPIPIYEETEPFYVPRFEIKVQGSPLPEDVVRDVMEVTYEDSVDKIDSFTLTINNWDAEKRAPKYVDLEEKPKPGSPEAKVTAMLDPDPNKKVELYMGYQGNRRLMMTGFITTLEPNFPQSAAPTLTVRGLNVLDKLRRKQYTWSWSDTRDSNIARELRRPPDDRSGRPGLDIEVRIDREAANNEPSEHHVFMNSQYPIVFLMERARRHGYSIYIAEEENGRPARYLYFGPSQLLRDVTYELEWGKSLLHFRPTLTTANQVSQVTVYGWNRRTKRRIEGTARLGERGLELNPDLHAVARAAGRHEVITNRPVHTPRQARALARDILLNQLKEMVKANGATVGLPDLRAGRAVIIKNVGYRFNGRYFVTQTTHTIDDSGYRTTFSARREETGRS
ncbi:MAG: phage late control D family protein [Anaerolineae bacterium]